MFIGLMIAAVAVWAPLTLAEVILHRALRRTPGRINAALVVAGLIFLAVSLYAVVANFFFGFDLQRSFGLWLSLMLLSLVPTVVGFVLVFDLRAKVESGRSR
ncbi:hypothetical protein ACIBP4_12090 [Micromonospora maritima]|uniref:Uncharacterized protein n=2 Tax=Micromonospora maritima TaxID=986711 RepID=A0ABW7ZK60_9ACTN